MENISHFVYNVGKCVLKDTKYSLMIPYNINSYFSEAVWHM